MGRGAISLKQAPCHLWKHQKALTKTWQSWKSRSSILQKGRKRERWRWLIAYQNWTSKLLQRRECVGGPMCWWPMVGRFQTTLFRSTENLSERWCTGDLALLNQQTAAENGLKYHQGYDGFCLMSVFKGIVELRDEEMKTCEGVLQKWWRIPVPVEMYQRSVKQHKTCRRCWITDDVSGEPTEWSSN